MFQVAQLEGAISIGDAAPAKPDAGTYYYQTDGKLSAKDTKTTAIEFKASGDDTKCADSQGCLAAKTAAGIQHLAGYHIGIKYTAAVSGGAGVSGTPEKWELVMN